MWADSQLGCGMLLSWRIVLGMQPAVLGVARSEGVEGHCCACQCNMDSCQCCVCRQVCWGLAGAEQRRLGLAGAEQRVWHVAQTVHR
jgi:hypothetical protein